MNRPRPAEYANELQAIKLGLSVMTVVDLHACHGLAIAMCWKTVELAGTAVRAVAVDELTSMNGPVGIDHISLRAGGCRTTLARGVMKL
jgi:hypothetical protein